VRGAVRQKELSHSNRLTLFISPTPKSQVRMMSPAGEAQWVVAERKLGKKEALQTMGCEFRRAPSKKAS